jgi:hypothetical protein
MKPESEYAAADRSQLDELRASFAGSAKRSVILWAVRWTLGFAAIGVAVYFRPQWAWLWWAGAGVAALSLVVMLSMRFFTLRRIDAAQRRIRDYERAARDTERQ